MFTLRKFSLTCVAFLALAQLLVNALLVEQESKGELSNDLNDSAACLSPPEVQAIDALVDVVGQAGNALGTADLVKGGVDIFHIAAMPVAATAAMTGASVGINVFSVGLASHELITKHDRRENCQIARKGSAVVLGIAGIGLAIASIFTAGVAAGVVAGVGLVATAAGLVNSNIDMFCGKIDKLIEECMRNHSDQATLETCEQSVLHLIFTAVESTSLPDGEYKNKDLYARGKEAAAELGRRGLTRTFLWPSGLRVADPSFWEQSEPSWKDEQEDSDETPLQSGWAGSVAQPLDKNFWDAGQKIVDELAGADA